MLSEPQKVLPKKAGGSFTKLASTVATHPDTAHRHARVRAPTQNILYTYENRHKINGSQHVLSTY